MFGKLVYIVDMFGILIYILNMFGILGYIQDIFEIFGYIRDMLEYISIHSGYVWICKDISWIYLEYILDTFGIYSEDLDVLGYIIWGELEFILRYTLNTFKYIMIFWICLDEFWIC